MVISLTQLVGRLVGRRMTVVSLLCATLAGNTVVALDPGDVFRATEILTGPVEYSARHASPPCLCKAKHDQFTPVIKRINSF